MSDTRHISDDGAALLGLAVGFFKFVSGEAHNMASAALAAGAGWLTVKALQHVYDMLFGKRGRKKKTSSYDPT